MPARGFDVVVPSYRRPRALRECLAGLAAQELEPLRVLVVARPPDVPTWDVVHDAPDGLRVEPVPVHQPGLVHALCAGVAATDAPRVAFTDDDAIPHRHWLAGLGALLDEPGVGVAGGRDLVPGELEPRRRDVGRLAPWGRLTGDHHLGRGLARDVHVVKGVNMAFRDEALALPRPGVLQGRGTQMHGEVLMCAWARSRGWRVRYDPAITVDHRVRPDEAVPVGDDPRSGPTAWRAQAHNRMLGIIASDPERAAVHIPYAFVVGSRETPGAARALWAVIRGERDVVRRVGASSAGQLAALRERRRLDDMMVSCTELRGTQA